MPISAQCIFCYSVPMQLSNPTPAPASATAAPAAETVHETAADQGAARQVVNQLQRSELFRDYQKAFETTTGLPLALRPVGAFQSPLAGSKNANAFCSMMAKCNKSCAACLQMQQRVETEAVVEAKTLKCFAGLNETSIPVRIGTRTIGFLQTGQVLFEAPSETRFTGVARQLRDWGLGDNMREFKAAYLQTRVLTPRQYASAVNLVTIFAQHLASLSNQVMTQAAQAESPVIARARAYIAEHQGEAITLRQVAAAVHLSSYYFCKLFHESTGLTFTEYLARTRVEAVKQALLNPHMRVSEAAYAAGFQSLSQFNRVFRRIEGTSPKAYRESLHGLAAPAARRHAA